MKLYFTRHGKTQWNQQRRLQGQTGDSPLLSESYLEIEKLGEHLRDISFSKIYCSPSLRARKTAEGICAKLKTPCEIVYKEGLREIGFGTLEGEKIQVAEEKFPTEMRNWQNDLEKYDPSAFGGETVEQLLGRFYKEVARAILEEETVLFVSHGAALRIALNFLTGHSFWKKELESIANNSLSILETEDLQVPFDLIRYNDISFL